ncbi:MAG: DUF3365 domain-containing protein [Ignavibacteria bacterium]|nr:DUF3365 domain-containing protein [Ignavibacteria bacterium]
MNRKIFLSAVVLTSLLLLNCSDKEMKVTKEQKEQMRTTAADFMNELKGTLTNQIKANGLVSALNVCSDTAQVLTNKFGLQRGVFIQRVSFRNRNENNFPDDYEQTVLNSFQEMLENNKLDSNTELAELVDEGGFTYLRYMKPILIQPECLNCHGNLSSMQKEIRRQIRERYPKGKAYDYKPGDLRGAISIKKLIE